MHTSSGMSRSILIAIVAASLCAAVHGQDKEAATKKPAFSLTILPVNVAVNVGSPVLVKVTMENTSQQSISVWRDNAPDQGGLVYKVDVWDDKGSLAEETKTGRRLQNHVPPEEFAREPYVINFSGAEMPLAPGKTITDQVDVSHLFTFGTPGKYVIQFHRFDMHSLSDVASNKVTVTLVSKQQKQD